MEPNEIPIPPGFVPPPEGPVRPPVVTTGSASTAPPIPQVPSAAQGQAQQPSMLDRLRQQVMQDIMPNEGLELQRRVRAFVAGMGDTRGQSLGTALAAGMGGVEQQRLAEQQARAQRVRSAEEDAYRQAQIRLQEAKQLYEQDPTNPTNRLRLAQAQQALAMAEYYRQGGRGANQEQRDRVVGQQRDADGNLYNVHESGRVTRVGGEGGPSFVDPERSPEARRYAAWSQARENLESRLRATAPSITESPEQREARIQNDLRAWLRNNPRPRAPWEQRPDPNAPAPAADAPAPNENRTRIDFNTGRPL